MKKYFIPAILFLLFILPFLSVHSQTPTFNRNLRYGSSGYDVCVLQQILINSGFITQISAPVRDPRTGTCYFGSITRSALAQFQTELPENILIPAGICQGIVNGIDTCANATGSGILGDTTKEYLNDPYLLDEYLGSANALYNPPTNEDVLPTLTENYYHPDNSNTSTTPTPSPTGTPIPSPAATPASSPTDSCVQHFALGDSLARLYQSAFQNIGSGAPGEVHKDDDRGYNKVGARPAEIFGFIYDKNTNRKLLDEAKVNYMNSNGVVIFSGTNSNKEAEGKAIDSIKLTVRNLIDVYQIKSTIYVATILNSASLSSVLNPQIRAFVKQQQDLGANIKLIEISNLPNAVLPNGSFDPDHPLRSPLKRSVQGSQCDQSSPALDSQNQNQNQNTSFNSSNFGSLPNNQYVPGSNTTPGSNGIPGSSPTPTPAPAPTPTQSPTPPQNNNSATVPGPSGNQVAPYAYIVTQADIQPYLNYRNPRDGSNFYDSRDHDGNYCQIDPIIKYLMDKVPRLFPWAHIESDCRTKAYNDKLRQAALDYNAAQARAGKPGRKYPPAENSAHSYGEAVDFDGMSSQAQGDQLRTWALNNAKILGLSQIIWRYQGWNISNGKLESTFSDGDHADHVHIGRPRSLGRKY